MHVPINYDYPTKSMFNFATKIILVTYFFYIRTAEVTSEVFFLYDNGFIKKRIVLSSFFNLQYVNNCALQVPLCPNILIYFKL